MSTTPEPDREPSPTEPVDQPEQVPPPDAGPISQPGPKAGPGPEPAPGPGPQDPGSQDPGPQDPGGWGPGAQPGAVGPGYGPVGLPQDTRNWALLAHLSALAAFIGIPNFVGPLIVWAVKKDSHPFVAEHSREALNFNLSVLLYVVAAIVVSIVTFGLGLILTVPLAIAAAIGWLIVVVIAGIKASNGEPYRYPLTIRFVS